MNIRPLCDLFAYSFNVGITADEAVLQAKFERYIEKNIPNAHHITIDDASEYVEVLIAYRALGCDKDHDYAELSLSAYTNNLQPLDRKQLQGEEEIVGEAIGRFATVMSDFETIEITPYWLNDPRYPTFSGNLWLVTMPDGGKVVVSTFHSETTLFCQEDYREILAAWIEQQLLTEIQS